MALTIGLRHFCTWGNKRCEMINITGDGATTTVQARLGRVEQAFVGLNAGANSEAAGYNPQLSFSGSTVTYAVAPTSAKTHTLFCIGID